MAKVTRNWIKNYIDTQPRDRVEQMVGRALLALLQRQTNEEQHSNDTLDHNGIGFTGADGKSGTLTAKAFRKNGRLLDWQLAKWTKTNPKGYPRLAKYWRQLNEAAEEQVAKRTVCTANTYRNASRAG